MTATKYYPPEFDPEIFAVPDPPPHVAAKVLEAARAADERVERFYRENPNAAEIDDRRNREIHERARQYREEQASADEAAGHHREAAADDEEVPPPGDTPEGSTEP